MSEWENLQADTYRVSGRFRLSSLFWGLLVHRTFRPIVTMRLCRMAQSCNWAKPVMLPLKFMHRITCQLACIDLPWQTKASGGLKITHGWGAVISPGAVIGSNVTIFHGVTIGRRDRMAKDGRRTTGYPIIEDQVWIGPHAIIVGAVTIGKGSRIAGGSFIDQDIAPYSVVAGNPSRVVKTGCTPDVMNPAPFHHNEAGIVKPKQE